MEAQLDPHRLQQIMNNTPEQEKPPKCLHKRVAVVSLIFTIIGLIILWTGAFVTDAGNSYGANGAFVILYIFAPTAFILVSNILLLVSVRRQRTNYGLSVTPVVFSSLTVSGMLINGMVFASVASYNAEDLKSRNYAGYYYATYGYYYASPYSESKDHLYATGLTLITVSSFVVFLAQIATLVVSALEIKRVVRTQSQGQRVIIVQAPPQVQSFAIMSPYGAQPQYIPPTMQVYGNAMNNTPMMVNPQLMPYYPPPTVTQQTTSV